ncbi:MAG: SDR family NAD(P)-dependent oxidoreductase, partial [Lutimaribacter sp.]
MKSILITGASAGIGAACAKAFLNAGWQVGLLARRAEALHAVADGHAHSHILP